MRRAFILTALTFGLISFWTMGCRRESPSQKLAASAVRDQTASPVVDEGCPHMVDGVCPSAPHQESKRSAEAGTMHFGAPLGRGPEVKLADVLAAPDTFHQKTVRLSGHVSRAC